MPKESELGGHVLSNIRIEPIDPLSFWLLSHTEVLVCALPSHAHLPRPATPFKATLM